MRMGHDDTVPGWEERGSRGRGTELMSVNNAWRWAERGSGKGAARGGAGGVTADAAVAVTPPSRSRRGCIL